jgi:hypothetical protein
MVHGLPWKLYTCLAYQEISYYRDTQKCFIVFTELTIVHSVQ